MTSFSRKLFYLGNVETRPSWRLEEVDFSSRGKNGRPRLRRPFPPPRALCNAEMSQPGGGAKKRNIATKVTIAVLRPGL